MSAAQHTSPIARQPAGTSPELRGGYLQDWVQRRVQDLQATGITSWTWAADRVKEVIDGRNSSTTNRQVTDEFCGVVAEKLLGLSQSDRKTLYDFFYTKSGFDRLAGILGPSLTSVAEPSLPELKTAVDKGLSAHSSSRDDQILFLKSCVVILLCDKTGESAPITKSQINDIVDGRRVTLDLSNSEGIASKKTALSQDPLNQLAPAASTVVSHTVTSMRLEMVKQDNLAVQIPQARSETALEHVSNLPASFISKLSELSHLFGHLSGSPNPDPQYIGTFKLPAGCRSYFSGRDYGHFALLDQVSNDFNFKTQVLAFVGMMIKNRFDATGGGLTSSEHREFDQLLMGFMHNYAIAQKAANGSSNEISQNFTNAVGYISYWENNTHYLERLASQVGARRFPRDISAPEIDTSSSFPMCIALAIRLYENISGKSLCENLVTAPSATSVDDSVLPERLRERFNALLAKPEIDRTTLEALRSALKPLDDANITGDFVEKLRAQITAEEERVSTVPEIKNRTEIERLRERAIELFGESRERLINQEGLDNEPYFVNGSKEFQNAVLDRTLDESSFALEPFKRSWLDNCILKPISVDNTVVDLTEPRGLQVRHPAQTALILATANSLGMELIQASEAIQKESVGYITQTDPESKEGKECLELIQSVIDQCGSIVTLNNLTPDELRQLPPHITSFRDSFPQRGREMLLDLLRSNGITAEVYKENEEFIQGLLKRNYDREEGDAITFWKTTDLRLIQICVSGHRDLKKISDYANIDSILYGVNIEDFDAEARELVINRLATVLFMAETFRGRVENSLSSVTGKMIKETLEHFTSIPEMHERIRLGAVKGIQGSYVINTLNSMCDQYERDNLLTPKQIKLAGDLVEAYKAILFELSLKLGQNSVGSGPGDNAGNSLMVHQRRIP